MDDLLRTDELSSVQDHYDAPTLLASLSDDADHKLINSIFWPQCHQLRKRIALNLSSLAIPDEVKKEITRSFIESYANKLEQMGRQAVLLEKKVATSATSRAWESYENFSEFMRSNTDRLTGFFLLYKELNRVAAEVASNYEAYACEFASNLVQDFPQIAKTLISADFSIYDIERVELSGSETHSGSRAVITVHALGHPQIVYKSRDLRFEAILTEALEKLNSNADNNINVPWILPKYFLGQQYGWVSYVEHKPALEDRDEFIYFERAGFLLGFCLTFRICDMTSDNVIAARHSPVPVDMETGLTHTKVHFVSGVRMPEEFQWNSMGTGLLPNWTWKGADMVGVDISGLGGTSDQYCSMPLYQSLRSNTDDESFGEEGVFLYPTKNVLYRDGKAVNAFDNTEAIEAGFGRFHRTFLANPQAILSVLVELRDLPSRFIARATAGYHYAITCSCHPSFVTDTNRRQDFLEKSLSLECDYEDTFLQSEIKSVLEGDVPRVVSSPGSLEICEQYHGQAIELDDSMYDQGFKAAQQFLRDFDDDRLRYELKLIKGSLAALAYLYSTDVRLDLFKTRHLERPEPGAAVSQYELQRGASQTFKNLDRYVQEELSSGFQWYGFKESSVGSLEYGLLGHDFYNGVSGVIWTHQRFLKEQRTSVSNSIVRRYVEDLIYEYENGRSKLGGLYAGISSTVLPFMELLKNSDPRLASRLRDAFLDKAEAVLRSEYAKSAFWGTDLFNGLSGTVAVLSLLAKSSRCERSIELATDFARQLLEQARFEQPVLFPQSPGVSAHPDRGLTGLSHGSIGIAVALATLEELEAYQDAKLVNDVVSTLSQWEVQQFSEEIYNWPDYRHRTDVYGRQQFAWSHGFPGIMLALQSLSGRGLIHVDKFLENHSFASGLQRLIESETMPLSTNISSGTMGIFLIAQRFGVGKSLIDELHAWGHLDYQIELESRPLRLLDSFNPGLLTGKAGVAMGMYDLSQTRSSLVPLLPSDFISQEAAT